MPSLKLNSSPNDIYAGTMRCAFKEIKSQGGIYETGPEGPVWRKRSQTHVVLADTVMTTQMNLIVLLIQSLLIHKLKIITCNVFQLVYMAHRLKTCLSELVRVVMVSHY